jgi:hypothetical protein
VTDKTKDTEGADVIAVTAPAMPNAANYADTKEGRKSFNLDMKKWDNAVWVSIHPKAAKAARVNGKVTEEAALEAAKNLSILDLPDCVKGAVIKEVDKGLTEGAAYRKVLTYHYNYHANGVARYAVFLGQIENWA